jgi:hypothetical protein
MIRWPEGVERLAAADRFGLQMLVDLSRVAPVDPDVGGDIVRLEMREDGAEIDVLRPESGIIVASEDSGRVTLPQSLARRVVAIASAAAEQHSTARDAHQRVPSSENEMVKGGSERSPVLSQWGTLLRESVVRAAGARPLRLIAPWPEGRAWAAAITHDLDVVDWWPLFLAFRLAELTAKRELGLVAKTLGAAAREVLASPVTAAVGRLLRAEADNGIRSTWFILSGTPTLRTAAVGDLTYDVRGKRAREILSQVAQAGHEIGLHGSFATMADSGAMREERERLRSVTSTMVEGVRQHYLRMRPGATQHVMQAAGFSYDATYGFPDRNGFRLGAADVLPGWDASAGREMKLIEVPLTWMDRALSKYAGIEEPEGWVEDGLALAEQARAAGGLWVGLWHPNMTDAIGFPGAPSAFVHLLERLNSSRPYIAPLGEIVAWRKARRAVRVRSAASGEVVAVSGAPTPAPLHLTDGAGRMMEPVRSTS